MAQINEPERPAKLYRYRPLAGDDAGRPIIDRELDAIEQGYVFAQNYQRLNDPMEAQYEPGRFLRSRRRMDTLQEIYDAKQAMGVASFSETHTNELMWAHYAGQFTGMCVCYGFSPLLKALDRRHSFTRITYSETTPIIDRPRGIEGMGADDARRALSWKNHRWVYEREWRLFAPGVGPAYYRRRKCITHVYIGSRAHSAHAEDLLKRLEPLSIPVSLMEIRGYVLTFARLR